ncbi:signal transduction histidine kinase regulating C4-dicarboxylate transport system [Vibrio variabilis]|uniref:Signal transduction histidine kinase regulating C4-dicarboxylate transport system n=1 Tax=Vibrio variabilis TaxID=990271 RepID=A0ABQ0JL69_9VIBR|nr:signal transduction histidine kinase regulating C4-dicarboxylate transport system [Vibrio variabilis]
MDLSSIERSWQSDNSIYVATDSNQIVFMSSDTDWLFTSLSDIDSETLTSIRDSRQYLQTHIKSLGFQGDLLASSTLLTNKRESFYQAILGDPA